MQVLIIEDEASMHSIMTSFLLRYAKQLDSPLQIKAMQDPVQGLFEATANGSTYDLILLDVRMPKLCGDEIYRSMMHVNPEILERVLFVTAYRDDLASRFPDHASLQILEKPFRYEAFAASLSGLGFASA